MFRIRKAIAEVKAKLSGRKVIAVRGYDRADRYYEYIMVLHPNAVDEARQRLSEVFDV